jgi:hypothetical protein
MRMSSDHKEGDEEDIRYFEVDFDLEGAVSFAHRRRDGDRP